MEAVATGVEAIATRVEAIASSLILDDTAEVQAPNGETSQGSVQAVGYGWKQRNGPL